MLMNGRFALPVTLPAIKVSHLGKAVPFVLGLVLYILFREPVNDILVIIKDRDAVVAYLDQFGVLAPALLAFILALQVLVAAIPGHILMLSAGYLFGFVNAFLLCLAVTVGTSQMAFWLARAAGRPVVERLAPAAVLNKWNKAAENKGLVFFTFSFMLPIFPADVMNFVAGLSSISWRRFLVANFVGRLPGVVLLTALGANGLVLTVPVVVLFTIAGLVMFGGWWFFIARSNEKEV
ncbi:MAG: VTT domain-containing protein [Candidatus Promineifilaceae bacterium]